MDRHSEYIAHLRQLRDTSDALIQRELRRTIPMGRSTERLKREAQRTLEIALPTDLSHRQLTRIRNKGMDVPRALSFQAALVRAWATHKRGANLPGVELDNKMVAYDFIDRLGVRRPAGSAVSYPLAELQFETPGVVKASKATGSKGVFLGFSDDNFVHVQDKRRLHSKEEFEAFARQLIKDPKWPIRNRWFTEELILESQGVPARDLKFYTFYGRVELVLETVRYPKEQAGETFWDRDGNPIETGRTLRPLDGIGIEPEFIPQVEAISSEIPRPYMRIDMLRGADELVFGEFTPRSGNFEKFSPEMDRRLGEAWADAESRLMWDLVSGKQFAAFQEAISSETFKKELGSARKLKG